MRTTDEAALDSAPGVSGAGGVARFSARDARPADNDALLALTAACPMQADVTICVRREPDFFALSRLEGRRWRVGVVDDPRGPGVIGCIAVAERAAYVNGVVTRTAYVSDLKVHPRFRGLGVADVLTRYACTACEAVDPGLPILVTALAGNRSIERRVPGPRGLPKLRPIGTVRLFSIPLLGVRRLSLPGGLTLRRAGPADLEEMVGLWSAVATARQLAPVVDGESLAQLLAQAPGLGIGSYWLARRGSGRLAGFVAFWDQQPLKRALIVRYSPRLTAFRLAFNAAAPLLRAPRLPAPGGELRSIHAFHLCVRAAEPQVLRALLSAAHRAYAGGEHAFLAIGLDPRDPLRRALRGLGAQPADIRAYLTTPRGCDDGPALDDRPLHFETALV